MTRGKQGKKPDNRQGNRGFDELRAVNITRRYLKFADGSVLIEMGDTRVICTATIEDRVPPFLQGTGKGWITAEYSMLPGSSGKRIPRESAVGRVGGRTHEIQRLIGRSLRAAFDLKELNERSVTVDCDVIQADGGTRCAAITGAYVAVMDALSILRAKGILNSIPELDSVCAVSVGMVKGRACLDLNYAEDSTAEVDMNVIMTGGGKFIEVQGTAESAPFTRQEMDALVELAAKGCAELTRAQGAALSKAL